MLIILISKQFKRKASLYVQSNKCLNTDNTSNHGSAEQSNPSHVIGKLTCEVRYNSCSCFLCSILCWCFLILNGFKVFHTNDINVIAYRLFIQPPVFVNCISKIFVQCLW